MGKKHIFLLLIICIFLSLNSVYADYFFNVERQEAHVWIQKDGSAEIWYFIHFSNSPGGRTIDIVDVGLPFDRYDLKTAKAAVDEMSVYDIRKSEYIPIGVEVHLSPYTIKPGKKGVVSLKIKVREMVFQDDVDDSYASVEFITNFFGDKYTFGKSLIEVYFHFPPGVQPDEPRYHKTEFTFSDADNDGILYYYWQIKEGDAALGYRFGASFPKKYLDEGVVKKVTVFSRIGMFFSNIFRNLIPSPLIVPCIFPYGIIAFFIILGIVSSNRRKMKYFKPSLSARGVGVKRGLTAVEAAVLLERKFDKIFSMIIFGLLKKGIITIESKKPFKIRELEVPKEGLHIYEEDFLKSFDKDGKPIRTKLKTTAIDLVKSVQKKMKNFNIRDTRNYYESIVETAWRHVQQADLEKSIDWVMLDKKYDKKLDEYLPMDTSIRRPTWWNPYYRGYYGTPYRHGTSGTGSVGDIGKATLSPKQFANSLATEFETASHNIVTSVESFTSGVTNVTNPVPKSSSGGWSSGSGGGGGCACACACAGCACACAGGGR